MFIQFSARALKIACHTAYYRKSMHLYCACRLPVEQEIPHFGKFIRITRHNRSGIQQLKITGIVFAVMM